jgi:hypothetical protein
MRIGDQDENASATNSRLFTFRGQMVTTGSIHPASLSLFSFLWIPPRRCCFRRVSFTFDHGCFRRWWHRQHDAKDNVTMCISKNSSFRDGQGRTFSSADVSIVKVKRHPRGHELEGQPSARNIPVFHQCQGRFQPQSIIHSRRTSGTF